MFREKHKRAGLMTNQPRGYRADRPHAATIVCERDECQDKARFYVQGVTGEPAVYVPDRKVT